MTILPLFFKAGGQVEIEYMQKFTDQSVTSVADNDMWFKAFRRGACDLSGLKIATRIFPAATDSRFIREVGVPALGFSPMPNTPILLHDHNEFLNQGVFLRGIDAFCNIISEIASI